jgi:hypothetical protein
MTKSTIGSGDGAPLSIGAPAGEYYFSGAFEKNVRFCFYQGMCKRMLCKTAISLHRGPIGEHVGFIYRGLWEIDEIRLWKRSIFLPMGALLGKPGEGAAFLGTLKDMWRKALEMSIFFHRAPLGNLEGAHWPWTFRGRWRWALKRERLILWELCVGNLEEGLFLGILKDMFNRALKSGAFFHRGLVLGNMEGMLLSKGLREICKRKLWKRTILSIGPRWRTWRVFLPGTLRYSKVWAPFLGPRGC